MTERIYGNTGSKEIKEYTLTNMSGMQVCIINYGGTVTKISTADKKGITGDVVLGFDSLAGYLQDENPYVGCLIGRYSNRIANAMFNLDGKSYSLVANNNGQSLHGGNKGFDKVVWNAEPCNNGSSLKLTYLSKDSEEGYPGNLSVTVIYTLTADNSLKIDYTATTDKATPVNLTSHCYFNLSAGADANILDHELQLYANSFTEINDFMIPTGRLCSVKNTPMDFIMPKQIGKEISLVKGGYDHNWVLNKNGYCFEKAASLYHARSGRFLEVYTTEPGMQFYSGNFLDGTLKHTKENMVYGLHAGLCLEAQHFPDSPNQPGFPDTILKPGETYQQTTLYKFSVK